MKPTIYYMPEGSQNKAIRYGKEWGHSFETRTINTDIGQCPCIDIKDMDGETIFIVIIDDQLYNIADNHFKME